MTTFDGLGLDARLVQATDALGFKNPTPIQEQAIPVLLSGTKDLVGLAQTGTGKTAAFGLPLLQLVDVAQRYPQALVVCPTRELCLQIVNEMEQFKKFISGMHVLAVYGGTSIGLQIRDLKRGVQIVVATPGRLIDLIERKAINLEQIKYVVLDEADEMLNMGFQDDIEFILQNTPQREATWLFSATMPPEIRRVSKKYMDSPKEITVGKVNTANKNIDHQYYVTSAMHRYEALKRLIDFNPGIYGIIFTRTKADAQEIAEKLTREGYDIDALHGDLTQAQRDKVMNDFREKTLQLLIATDVAARGIDVQGITHVINYELPDDVEVYTHRSGRTGRAGKSGVCMSLVTSKEIGRIRQVERMAKTRFHKSDIPDGAEVVRKRLFHFLDKIEEAQPEHGFGEIYKKSIHEKFEAMDKDELINRLLWLQLKDTIKDYENAPDLNAGYVDRRAEREASGTRSGSVRLFINIGTKDGASTDSLIRFIAEMTDIEPHMVSRVTVRELSSFFNVPADAAEFIAESLTQRKFNNRKIRIEEADNKPGFGGGSGYGKPRDSYRKGGYEKKDYGSEPHKFTRARKPQNKY